MPGTKGKRKAPPAAAAASKRPNQKETSRQDETKARRINVDDLHDGLFFKQRSEMNAEQRERFAAYERQRDEEAEEAEREREEEWEASKQFKPSIIDPKASNYKFEGSKMKGFTVWSSDVDPYGGCGATKEFDSTWTTKSDANERARYVFYWKNTWGMDPEEIHCDEEVEIDGLKKYKVQPDDSSTWTVGVVPDIAFKYLDNADCTRRKRDDHGHDEDAVFLDLNY